MKTLEPEILATQLPVPTSLDTLLSELRHLDIRLWVEGERLRYKAAKGTLAPELLAQLRDRKAEIIEFLKAASLAADPSAANIPVIARAGNLPLSIAQERLWYHHQFEPESSLNNIITAYKIDGNLDLELLDRAQHAIAQRHEILRTTFPTVDGQPTIQIAPEWSLSIPIEDLQHIPAAERDEVAHQRAIAESRRAYDLETGPLFRMRLLQLEPDKYLLVLTMHRMMADGVSVDIVFRELVTHYQAYLLGRSVVLPELPIQYIDYAHWQRQRLQGEFLDRHLRYWKEHLKAPLPQVNLPISRPRPATYCFNTQRRRLIFPKQLHDALNTLSKAEEVTLFMTLMAALKVLLYPYAEREDVTICCSNAGRNRAEIEHAIGPFFNTLAIRTDLSGNPTFRETIAREKQVALGAFAHQDLPFEQLVPELDTSGNKGRSSLFKFFFALNPSWKDGNTLSTVELPGVTFDTMFGYLYTGKTKFDLFLVAREAEEGLQLLFEYNSDLFDPEVILPIMDRFQTLLESIVANPDRPIAELSVLTPLEQQQVVVAIALESTDLERGDDLVQPLSSDSIAPRTPTEQILADLWIQVLGVEKIGIYDNFFRLGGHSLLATQLILRCRQTFSIELPLRQLFELPTVADLATAIDKLLTKESTLSEARIIPHSGNSDNVPLSFAQQRLWFLDRLEPDSPFYNLFWAEKLQGDLNLEVLQQSLDAIVVQHEVLRTTYSTENGSPKQSIGTPRSVELAVFDLQQYSGTEREDRLQTLLQQQSQRSFNLSSDLMFRGCSIQLAPRKYVLLVVMHHIASDGWSIGIFREQLTELYTAFLNGKPNPLAALPIQYADYAVWQRAWLTGEVLDTQLNYWQQQLAGASPILELPTDYPRPPVQTYRGARQSLALSATLTTALKQLGDREGVTLYMTLLAAFQTLLYRYSGQEDILVGSPIAGRNRAEIERLIGFFVNTLVLRADLSGNPSFQELLMRVRGTTLEAFAHQDLPFEKLVEEINPERSLSYSPLFQVMFVFQNTPRQTSQLPGLTQTSVELTTASSQFDLTLSVEEQDGALIGSWNYNTDLFDPDTIDRMNEHFQILLAGIVANPDRSIAELPMLTAPEQQQLLGEWQQPQLDAPQDKCIHHWFEERVDRHPDGIAVVFENQQLTYRELNNRANQLANYLMTLGVKPDTLVGLCVDRSIETIVGILGILKAGGAYVPLDPSNPQDRLEYILKNAQVQILVTQSTWLASLPECDRVVCLDTDERVIAQYPETNPVGNVHDRNLAYIIYTSGSTGQPKGVLVNHHNVVRLFTSTESWYHFNEKDVWTLFHSFAFDFSVWEIWGALFYGGRIVVVPYSVSRDTVAFYNLLISERVTVLNQTPSAFYQLIEADRHANPIGELSLRLVIFGGEALNMSNLEPWFDRHGDRFPQLVNMYGITETTVHVTYRPLTLADVKSGSLIGRPIPDLQIYLLDKYRQPVPIGVQGEMYVGGAGVAQGYWQRDELTQERFIANPFSKDPHARLYKSGDLARYLKDGSLEYIGRIDNQVKIRGFRIELGEIEAVLAQHAGIRELTTIVREDIPGDKRLVAYIVPQPERPQIGELRSFLAAHLPSYMVPNFFVFLDNLPLTANGKVDRRALPAPDLANQESGAIFVAAQDDLERELTKIWEQVLNVEPIGIQDNFFDLGGHSLLAVRLFSQIEQIFGKNLPLATLFRAPTIEQLAEFLRQEQPPQELWGSLVPLQTDGSKHPLFCIHGGGFNVFIYRALAQYLGSERPVYALQARGLDGDFGSIFDRIEDMATDYIQQIKTIQPQGPYLLSGLSNGGNIALEMAQQLQASGETVALVAMFDCYGPDGVKLLPSFPRFLSSLLYVLKYSVPRSIVKSRQSGHNPIARLFRSRDKSVDPERNSVENLEHQHTSISREPALEAMMNRVSNYIIEHSPWAFFSASAQLKDSNDSVANTLKKLEDSYSKAYKAYTPQPYQGKIVIFQAMESPPGYHIAPKLGWEQIAMDELELHKIPGNHTSIMASPILAEKMKACLDNAINEKSTS